MSNQNEKNNHFWTPQFVIGVGVTSIAILGVFLLSWKSITCGNCQNEEQIKYVLGVVLPLLGTWVGTVLAFYFSKDNFESANTSVKNLVNHVTTSAEKLRSIMVNSVMIPKAQISGFSYAEGKKDADYTIKDLITAATENDKNRLPIFNANGSIRYIVHRSILDKYISTKTVAEGATPLATTVENLLKDNADINLLFNALQVVAEDDTLAKAKRLMDSKKSCLDVFVTENGSTSESVTGWITNLVISKNSKV